MKIIKVLAIITIISLSFGEIPRFTLANDFALKLIDVCVAITSAVWIVYVIVSKKFRKIFITYKYLLVFPAAGFVSLLINTVWLKPQEVLISLFYLLRWTAYISFIPLLNGFDNQFKKKLLAFFFVDGFIFLFFGFIQYLLYPSLKNIYYLGWDEHMYRLVSSILDPNLAGSLLVFYLLLISTLIYNFVKYRNVKYIILLSICFVFTLSAIFLTYSRSSLLMLIVSVGTFLFLINRKRLLVMLFAVIAAVIVIQSPQFYRENTNLFRFNSIKARVESNLHALYIFQENPVFGVGFNSYRYAQIKYGFRQEKTPYPSHADAGTDNSILFILATTGILGLTAYIYLWARLLRKAIFIYYKKSNILGALFLSMAIGLFIHSLFINSLFYSACMLWLWSFAVFMENKLL